VKRIHVIASQRVGAKRRPMTGSAKQSMEREIERWIASPQALLAMAIIRQRGHWHPSQLETDDASESEWIQLEFSLQEMDRKEDNEH
jgi:hypothetical protein